MSHVVELEAKSTNRHGLGGLIALHTSAALAAALRGSSPPLFAPGPPTVLPGVLDVIFCGTGADVGCVCELLPRTRPGVEN